MNTKKSKLQQIREQVILEIISWLERHNIDTVYAYDINPGWSPVLQEDFDNEDNTFTLDSISKKVIHHSDTNISEDITTLLFDGSSCFANHTWTDESISTDALFNIAEHLEDNEDYEV